MNGPAEQYTKELSRKFGYRATWLPGSPLSLGDIGTLDGAIFNRRGNLRDKNINFEIVNDATGDDLEYMSSGGVDISTKLAGKTAPEGSALGTIDAGVIVNFSKEKAIFFKALNTKNSFIKDITKVGDDVVNLFKNGHWEKEYVVITELITAESATILISNSNNGKVELKANANIAATKIDIADAEFDWDTKFSRGMETKIISQAGNTPLFKLQGIKKGLFEKPKFRMRGAVENEDSTATSKQSDHDSVEFGFVDEVDKY